jgi:PmbA protein
MSASHGEIVSFSFPKLKPQNFDCYHEDTAEMEISELINEGQRCLQYLATKEKNINLKCMVNKSKKKYSTLNSNGLCASFKNTYYSIVPAAIIDGSVSGVYKYIVSEKHEKILNEDLEELLLEYRLMKNTFHPETKRMKVLFSSDSLYSLMWRIKSAINGYNLYQELSPISKKLNEKLFSEKLTIIDDPLINSAFARPFDDEGVVTKRREIIKNGVLKNFMYDLSSGGRAKEEPTGNGFKREMFLQNDSIALKPSVDFCNPCIVSGEESLEDIIKSMDEGIIVKFVLGAHSGNILQGEYSMNVGIGFYVKDGKILGRVIDSMVSGNIYEDLKNISAISNKAQKTFDGIYPDILINNVSVTGK